ncbi:hypothetical protein QBC34DRAFT_408148 [Podospora aff. communis PSN243]|uniref:Uncharacterized protein n=1 Tax=Podospora aff. communis PSN243 TaxID=3040156 RepID=A0AAV9GL67_9PEZI|nr:hypothetical protein QBC34DRAFT_408148 [Podospora aff. communis PSN243]
MGNRGKSGAYFWRCVFVAYPWQAASKYASRLDPYLKGYGFLFFVLFFATETYSSSGLAAIVGEHFWICLLLRR